MDRRSVQRLSPISERIQSAGLRHFATKCKAAEH